MPIVGLDYSFPGLPRGALLTVLIVVEVFSGACESILVAEKGAADLPVRMVVQALVSLGICRVLLYTDQEASIVALAQAVAAARDFETLVFHGARYDSQSKGRVEHVVGIHSWRTIENHWLALRAQLQDCTG